MSNITSRLSEWFMMTLEEISAYFFDLIDQSYKTIIHKITTVIVPEHVQYSAPIKSKPERKEVIPDESHPFEKDLIIKYFKAECHPDNKTLETFRNNYTYIDNIYTEIQDRCLVSDKKFAISELCRLLNISKTYLPNNIPNKGFDPSLFANYSDKCCLIYFDTRTLLRGSDESVRLGYQISDEAERIAILCSNIFGLNTKGVKSVKGVMNIITCTLELWSNAKILEGTRKEKQINKVRIRYKPYLIMTKNKLIEIAHNLKSCEELEVEKQIVNLEPSIEYEINTGNFILQIMTK